MKTGTKLFAVTDQHVIIPLVVTSLATREDYTKAVTEIVGESTSHAQCHHETYFMSMWLEEDGSIDKANVFTDVEQAKVYAIERVDMALATINRQICSLGNQRNKLENT